MLLLFSFIFAVCSAQQLIELKTFRGGNVQNPINAQGPYSVYVSAYSDSSATLKSIFLNLDDGTSISLNDLKNNKLYVNSGLLQPYPVNGRAYVTTILSDNQMNSLKGLMYISTAKQLTDTSFYVIDVTSSSQTVDYRGIGAASATVLFLNTDFATNPYQSSVISGWIQATDATAFLYREFPTDAAETQNTQFFSNPVHTSSFDYYFPTVEKFSLSMRAFYLKTYKGVKFNLQAGYYDINGATTSAKTTTGFYMKPVNGAERTVTINTLRDTTTSNTLGTNVIGSMPTGAKVEVGVLGGRVDDSTSFPPTYSIFPWSTPYVGTTFHVSSTGGTTGEFYCQYYLIQGAPMASSTSAPTLPPANPTVPHVNPTSRPIQTTTKSSQSVQLFLSSIVALIGARFL